MPVFRSRFGAGLVAASMMGTLFLAGGPHAGTARALCAGLPGVEESYERSHAVFSGEVIRAGLKDPDPGDDDVWGGAEFRVDESWKGVPGRSAVVYALDPAYNSGGFLFERGRSYLVYADRHGDGLRVESCGRTTALANADEDFRALGPPERLTDTGGPSLPATGALVAAVGLLVSAGLMYRWARS